MALGRNPAHIARAPATRKTRVRNRLLQNLKPLAIATYRGWMEDDGFRLAAALAYYALFSLAPLMLISAALAGSILNQQHARELLADRIYEVLGTPALPVVHGILQHIPDRRLGTVSGMIGIVLMLIGASAVFVELQDAFNLIWRTKTRDSTLVQLVRERAYGFVLVVITAALLLASAVLTTGAVAASGLITSRLGFPRLIIHYGAVVVSISITTLLFASLFKLIPQTRVAWRDAWVSACVTAVLFEVGKLFIALYLSTSTVISLYGAAASLVLLLAWIYYSAVVIYFGAEFAKAYSLHREQTPLG